MNNLSRKKPTGGKSQGEAERRKVGMVVHDDRGNASVSWRDAPADFDRPVLEVLGEHQLTVMSEETCDPYARRTARRAGDSSGSAGRGGRTRSDLRKLSDWIKMMREREQRKREGGGGESGG
jgi:hypothetical protein